MNIRRISQLLQIDSNVISIIVAVFTGLCVVGRQPTDLIQRLLRACGFAEEVKTVIHFLFQCPFLERYRFLIALSYIHIKDIVLCIKLSDWFSSVG